MAELPPLNALRAFLYAAETQSFKKAAERLFVTQAAVSHQIRLLEDSLETQLFLRLNREVRLTDEGARLLPYVRSAFRALKSGVDQLRADPSPDRLVISVLPSFASRWLLSHLKGFQASYPDIHLVLRSDKELEDFEDSDCDLAIRLGEGKYPNLRSEFLMRDAKIVAAHPSLTENGTISIERLKTLPLLEDAGPDGSGWLNWLTEQELDPDDFRISLTVNDSGMAIDATLDAQGIGLIRKSLAQDLVASGKLIKVSDYEINLSHSYYLVAPEHHFQKTKVKIFAEWLHKELEACFLPEYFAYYGS